MKQARFFIFFGIIFLVLWACKEGEKVIPTVKNEIPVKVEDDVSYRFLVRGKDKLDIRLQEHNIQLANIFLTAEDDTTMLAIFTSEKRDGFKTANIEYPFLEAEIDMLLEFKKNYNDTLYQVPILDYKHQFVEDLTMEKLVEFTDALYDYDISPDGTALFYSVNPPGAFSNLILYRHDLQTNENTLIDKDFKGWTIRAISGNEFYYVTTFDSTRYMGLDSAFLMRKSLLTNKEKKVALVQRSGSFSRVVDNRMLTNAPLSGSNYYHINTTTDELRGVELFYEFISTRNRDNIWLGNYRIRKNTSLQSFKEGQIPSFFITGYDEDAGQLQGLLYNDPIDDRQLSYNKLIVYRDGNILFQEKAFKTRYSIFIHGSNLAEKPLIVFQQNFDDTKGANDGYYLYNQAEPDGKLLYSKSGFDSGGTGSIFWIDNESFIIVEWEGLYKFTVPADL